MSFILISAAMTAAIAAESGVPSEIVYLPEGEHDITPTVNGKAQRIKVRVPADKGEAIAAKLQASLADRQKQNVRPWFDFEHKGGKASAIPTAFRHEPGKGIMASVEWTGAGKAAIEGRDFSYLSPTFLIDDQGIPSGLPERGPLAALVNEPAFREIPRIAASDAAVDPETNHSNTMSKLIFAALAISAAHADAETLAVQAIDKLKTEAARLKAENEALTKRVDASDAATAAARKDRADTLVKAAVANGRLLAKDTDKQDKFRTKIESGDTFAEEILAQLPKLNQGLDNPIVLAADGKPLNSEVRIEAAQAKARAELGSNAGFAEVWSRATEIDPSAFD